MMRMKLATRLTCYFLACLAAVLVGFSTALYMLANYQLQRQLDERLESGLNTLAAAAEVGPEGVEWEPHERALSFGRRTLEGGFAWRVGDERGRRVDGSAAGDVDAALDRLGMRAGPGRQAHHRAADAGHGYRGMTLRLDRPRPDDPADSPAPGRHEALIFGAAASTEGMRATLFRLALTLAGLSGVIWAIALVCGGRLCRVALRPVTIMAQAAHEIDGSDSSQRLPSPGSGDELDELGRSFNALLDRLAESLERQQRFAGDASHQLRTPLTAIKGQVELALRQDRPADEYRRVLGLVLARSRHLGGIVDGLMFLSRADAEAMQPALERVAIAAWLDRFLETWASPRLRDVVRAFPREACCLVQVHPPLLGELVGNLLDNAAKYSPPGTPIRLELGRSDGEVALSIVDAGAGVQPGDLARIFDPFFRAEADRLRGTVGTGLGLSVAARIATAFGGRIRAESEPGRGARFTLFLPACEVTPAR